MQQALWINRWCWSERIRLVPYRPGLRCCRTPSSENTKKMRCNVTWPYLPLSPTFFPRWKPRTFPKSRTGSCNCEHVLCPLRRAIYQFLFAFSAKNCRAVCFTSLVAAAAAAGGCSGTSVASAPGYRPIPDFGANGKFSPPPSPQHLLILNRKCGSIL